jgi:hypothetical protein
MLLTDVVVASLSSLLQTPIRDTPILFAHTPWCHVVSSQSHKLLAAPSATSLALKKLNWNPLMADFHRNSIQEFSSYLTGNTLRLRYRDQPVNAVWRNSRCLLWEPYGTHRYSPYLTGNTLRHRYREQPVNAVWRNSRCLLWEQYGTHRYTLWAESIVLDKLKRMVHVEPLSSRNALWWQSLKVELLRGGSPMST